MSETAPPGDRAAAARPIPKPGIMDIHAYVPGKAKAEGIADPIKLSANENALGSSPKAREAYLAASMSLRAMGQVSARLHVVAVEGWQDTADKLDALLETLPAPVAR